MTEQTPRAAAYQLYHPRSRAPNGFHASLVTRADLLRDDVLANRVREVRAAVDSRFKDTTVHVFRLEDFKDLIKYSLEELDWQIFHDVARDVFWGYRRVDDEPSCCRPSIAPLLEDIERIMANQPEQKQEATLSIPVMKVSNVTVAARLDFKVDVDQLHRDPVHGKGSILQSHGTLRFVKIKIKPRILVIVHESGNLILTGAKTVPELEECLRKLMPVLLGYQSQ